VPTRRSLAPLVAAAVAFAAACDNTGGTAPGVLPDTVAAQAAFKSADSAFRSPGYVAFSLGPYGPFPSSGDAPFVPVPDSMLGKTMEWDTVGLHYYAGSRGGAPATGVRVVGYARDALLDITSPLTEVARGDYSVLVAVDTPTIRIVASGAAGTPVYVDLTRTQKTLGSTMVLSGTGVLSNQLAGALRTLHFTTSVTYGDSVFGYSIDARLEQPAVRFGGVLADSTGPGVTVDDRDFFVTFGGRTLRAVFRERLDSTGDLRTTDVYVDGRLFARTAFLGGEAPVWYDALGQPLAASDAQYAEAVVSVVFTVGHYPLAMVAPD